LLGEYSRCSNQRWQKLHTIIIQQSELSKVAAKKLKLEISRSLHKGTRILHIWHAKNECVVDVLIQKNKKQVLKKVYNNSPTILNPTVYIRDKI